MNLMLPMETDETLLDRILVAATGPLVTVLLGGLVVWGVTNWIQQKNATVVRERENARADQVRRQDLARADAEVALARHGRDDDLRHELVTQMTETAGSLYLSTQHYWRTKRTLGVVDAGNESETLREARQQLDAAYLKSRVSSEVIENRLEGYFMTSTPRDHWHTVIDLLTVRYFQLIDLATDNLYAINSGDSHSGLQIEDLRKPQVLLARYQTEAKSAIRSVFETPLRARS